MDKFLFRPLQAVCGHSFHITSLGGFKNPTARRKWHIGKSQVTPWCLSAVDPDKSVVCQCQCVGLTMSVCRCSVSVSMCRCVSVVCHQCQWVGLTLTMIHRHWHIGSHWTVTHWALRLTQYWFSYLWIFHLKSCLIYCTVYIINTNINVLVLWKNMCQGFRIRSVVSCVDVSGLQHPTTFTQKTFNGPLHVYFPNTHAHERSLREVNIKTVELMKIVGVTTIG